ncbi:uracil-DNA glycosylase [Halalkalirubrum salinum]|uniref:uracil-DNA glycosylase n=1 Tax=Halalkalirubrum salinum TaxID=2563889 RepID=UPI0010FBACA9|nr:uracil-DNA glycosylase [Halalkalirubrum salinum]
MDANQRTFSNPFSMDENCTNCSKLCAARERIVHGYGDVGAEFLFVGVSPSEGAEQTGVPFTGDQAGRRLQEILRDLGFVRSEPDAAEPDIQNAFLTYLTRCRHPDREPTDTEIDTCEPFLNSEIRMINPQLIVPIGQRALDALAIDYTTYRPGSLSIEELHATTLRGRGFELLPMINLTAQTDEETNAFVTHVLENVFSRDYRQTKGRQSR